MIYFVTRHPGAVEWARKKGIEVDEQISHLDTSIIQDGDIVIGTLPIHLAAEICEKGGSYYHLSINVPPEYRGKELTADQMDKFGARIEQFDIKKVDQTAQEVVTPSLNPLNIM